jgi:hypothetical protein
MSYQNTPRDTCAVIACVLCENPSTLQNIILSSEVGTGCNSRLPAFCVGSINYIIFYTSMFFHILYLKVKLVSDRTKSLRYILMLISMLVRHRNGLELDLVGNSLVICNRID